MPEWFDKARQTIARPAAEPQPFERRCRCGETVRGVRGDEARQVACPNCGRPWFVLPRDTYPKTRTPRGTAPPLLDRLRPNARRKASGTGPKPAPTAASGTIPAAAPAKDAAPRTAVRDRLRGVAERVKERAAKSARPTRLVAAGILAVVLLTGGWLWHRSRLEAAATAFVETVPQAEAALAVPDLATAERLYARAAAAADRLGRDDAAARQVRQRHRELVAINGRAAQTPFDLAAEAGALAADSDRWRAQFDALYAGRWLIVDAPISAVEVPAEAPEPTSDDRNDDGEDARSDEPRPASKRVVRLGLPLVAGDVPVRFEVDAAAVAWLGPKAQRVVLAARYGSFAPRRLPGGRTEWVVRFAPGSAFPWATPETYAAIGFDLDDATSGDPPRVVLARQAKSLGLEAGKEPPRRQEVAKGEGAE